MRAQWVAAVAAAAQVASAGHSSFNVHDDLLAYPQFQVAIDESYVLQADAQSKLDSASSQASAKSARQTASSDHGVSLVKAGKGKTAGSRDGGDGQEIPQSYEYMVLDSLPYLCSIPQVSESELNDTSTPVNPDEEAKELARVRAKGSQLIGHMDEVCLYYVSGWWSYSFCYNSEVRQFHSLPPGQSGVSSFVPVEDETVPSYVLGRSDGQKSIDPGRESIHARSSSSDVGMGEDSAKASDLVEVQSSGDLKYLVQTLDDGTVCDLTNRPRKIEVQYHCAPGPADKISSVKEISTCRYRMIVYTPKLCDDVAFQPPPETPQHLIVCREVVSEDNLPEWKARKEAESKERVAQSIAEQLAEADRVFQKEQGKEAEPVKQPPLIIGGIEVGGHKTVGGPDTRIEPPKNFLAPQAKDIVTLVKYDPEKNEGHYLIMSEKDMEAIDIQKPDMEEIRNMAEKMYKQVPKKRWRIVLTNEGRGVRVFQPVLEEGIDLDELQKQKGSKPTGAEKPRQGEAQKDGGKRKENEADDDRESEKGSEEEYYLPKEEL